MNPSLESATPATTMYPNTQWARPDIQPPPRVDIDMSSVVIGCWGLAICINDRICRVWATLTQGWPCSVFLETGHRVWGSRDVPDPTTADAPDDGLKRGATRGYFNGPNHVACFKPVHGSAVVRSLSRLLGGSTSLSPDARRNGGVRSSGHR